MQKVNLLKKIILIIFVLISFIFFLKWYTNFIYFSTQNETFETIKNHNIYIKKMTYDRLINKFEREAYDSLVRVYSNHEEDLDFLNISIQVSNKWNYDYASYQVFKIISETQKQVNQDMPDLNYLDLKTRKISLNYLVKAYNEGNPNAKKIINNYTENKIYLDDLKQSLDNLRDPDGSDISTQR
ncbi:hypothetical protein DMB65_02135 [Flavobacterium cheongpyeongense]|uniref:Uncharacterized protein n=2 Tax=Flavobacterium TaxID=237 RepID=A0A2V4BV01_9FLAO|nr:MULTISPECIES: hypothetical protein [Flavobacterium]PXY42838.1 hypothetical protein DMB65_02135 [Flavobacterium cheongpyeongense]